MINKKALILTLPICLLAGSDGEDGASSANLALMLSKSRSFKAMRVSSFKADTGKDFESEDRLGHDDSASPFKKCGKKKEDAAAGGEKVFKEVSCSGSSSGGDSDQEEELKDRLSARSGSSNSEGDADLEGDTQEQAVPIGESSTPKLLEEPDSTKEEALEEVINQDVEAVTGCEPKELYIEEEDVHLPTPRPLDRVESQTSIASESSEQKEELPEIQEEQAAPFQEEASQSPDMVSSAELTPGSMPVDIPVGSPSDSFDADKNGGLRVAIPGVQRTLTCPTSEEGEEDAASNSSSSLDFADPTEARDDSSEESGTEGAGAASSIILNQVPDAQSAINSLVKDTQILRALMRKSSQDGQEEDAVASPAFKTVSIGSRHFRIPRDVNEGELRWIEGDNGLEPNCDFTEVDNTWLC